MLLLFFGPLGLLWLLVAAHRRRLGFGNLSRRGALVVAYLVFEGLVLAITELASVGHHLTAGVVDISWLVVTLVLLVAAAPQLVAIVAPRRTPRAKHLDLRSHARRLGVENWIWVGVVAAIFTALVVEGAYYPPVDADALVYHLSRVEHWIQNQTVAPFASHYLALIEYGPLSEYNLTHLHLMSGTDRFDWTVQLLSAVISVIGVSELARLLGGSRTTQVTASVICATIPSGILFAATVENDYFASALGVCLLVVAAAFTFGRRWGCRLYALGGAAGLAYMAKGDMLFMMAPPALVLVGMAGGRRLRHGGLASVPNLVRQIVVMGAGALVTVLPFLVENVQLFGSTSGPLTRWSIDSPITVNGFGANVVRSIAANFDIGNGTSGIGTYVSRVALGASHSVYSLFGISANDDRFSTTPGVSPFAAGDYSYAERLGSLGANPWHLLLLVAAFVVLLVVVVRGGRRFRTALLFTVGLGIGFVLFSGVAKWSLYSVRYTLPVLVAGSAVIAVALSRFPRWVGRFVLVGLVLACLPQLLDNQSQPLVPPVQFTGPYLSRYFTHIGNDPAAEGAAYENVTDMVAQSTCRRVGLANWVLYEYPLWAGLQRQRWRGRIDDVDVHNETAKLEVPIGHCAWIRQEGSSYVTPDNGTVNVQFDNLALSLDPDTVGPIRVPVPGFESTVHGARVFPGGDWNLTGLGHLLLVGDMGSLYVYSDSPRTVELRLDLPQKLSQGPVSLSGPDGRPVPTVRHADVIEADVSLHAGANELRLSGSLIARVSKHVLGLTGVRILPPTPASAPGPETTQGPAPGAAVP